MNPLINFLIESYNVPSRILDHVRSSTSSEQDFNSSVLMTCTIAHWVLTNGVLPKTSDITPGYLQSNSNSILARALLRHTGGENGSLTKLANTLVEAFQIPGSAKILPIDRYSDLDDRNTATVDLAFSIYLTMVEDQPIYDTSAYWEECYFDGFLATAVCRKFHKSLTGLAILTAETVDENSVVRPDKSKLNSDSWAKHTALRKAANGSETETVH